MLGQNYTVAEGGLRGTMHVYAARDYRDANYRKDDNVEVNAPEYMPTTPQNAEFVNISIPKTYFANKNFPATRPTIKSLHFMRVKILEGTRCPARFNKGAEFILIYIGGKVEDGRLIFIKDRLKTDDEETPDDVEWENWEDRVNTTDYDRSDLDAIANEAKANADVTEEEEEG